MKCAKCGAELKVGCIYCSVCGQEAQIVPDYSILEDDYLRALLEEENKPKEEKKPLPQKPVKKKKKKWPWILLLVVIIVLTIGAIVGLKMYRNYMNENSYDYQMKMAESELTDRNYENALGYYKNALKLSPNDGKVRIAMAKIYMEQRDYDSAMVLLMDVIQLDDDNVDAYKLLIEIYEKKNDYDSIIALKEDVKDEKILALFQDYTVEEPEFSEEEGEYDEFITVELTSPDDDTIYYTLDGSDPIEKGKKYEKAIELEEAGTYELRAVCCNDKDIYSDVAEATYVIKPKQPDTPVVTPDGGDFSQETLITIEVPEGCSAYYTFDNTKPTTESTRYEGPFAAPAGKNILRVIVVDETTGLVSDEYSRQFTYRP